MRNRLLETSSDGQKTYALVLEPGEEAMATITAFADAERLGPSRFTAIGAFARCELGYFNPETKEFVKNVIEEQVEVLSFLGNIAEDDEGRHEAHIHVVLGCRNAMARGGHLIAGLVRPTLEVMLVQLPGHLHRRRDPVSGLILLQP
ncbi:MAG: PPC domain-containing DNA-binding protein [Alphaproteobacteria bacterium]